jgi:hypothetical protein
VDSTPPSSQAKIQGAIDVLISLGGALAGVLSSMIVTHSSYAILSLLLIPLVIWIKTKTE